MSLKFSKCVNALAITLLFGALIAPLAVVHSEYSFKISGTLTDGSGSPLNEVTILVYTKLDIVSGSTLLGDTIWNVTSDEAGYFQVPLEGESYTIILEKTGYKSINLAVDLSSASGYTFSLGKIIMENSLRITTSTSTLQIHDGESFNVPLTISNDGDDETASIAVICGAGYSTSVYNSANQLVQDIYLPSGSSTPLSVKVTAPLNAANSNLTIKLYGNLVTENTVQLKVIEAGEIILGCTYPGMDVYPSDSFSFTVALKNPFYHMETFSLNLDTPTSWSLSVKNDRGEKINSVTLGAEETASFMVVGNVPSTSTSGRYNFTLKASANGKSSEVPMSVTINEVSAELTLTSKYPSQVISLGKTVVYPITIKNPGTKQLMTLSVDGIPSGWKALFMTGDGTQVNSILIDADSSESVNLEVTPSLSSSKTDYSFTVKVDGEYSSGEIKLKASIGGSYGLSMSVASLYEEINAGSAFTETIVLTNTGYSPLNNVELSLTYPDGWTVTASPIKVTTIESNSKTTFMLTITAPSGTAAQDYLVQVTAVSDEASTSQQSIRVTVNVESSWSIYGIVLLVLAAGGFALLYKKIRRR